MKSPLYLDQWMNGHYEIMRFSPEAVEFIMIMPLKMAKLPLSIEMILDTGKIPDLEYATGYSCTEMPKSQPARWMDHYSETLNTGWKPSKEVYFEQLKKLYEEMPNITN